MIADNTPVIIGVGQYSERVGQPGYEALSYMDLAGRALVNAIDDSQATGAVAVAIDTLACIRQFEISRADRDPPFGGPDNRPRAIAKRVGANPARAILSTTGGQTNQQLLGEFASEIAAGKSEVAVIVGSEAISTALALAAKGEAPDWSEEIGGELEDHGFGTEDLLELDLFAHGATGAIPLYAFCDNARRAKLGKGLQEYRQDIGELFAPFTQVAAANPHSAAPVVRSAEELAAVTERNRIVAEPYTRMTVARDQVNQAAAIIVASASKARELGVPEEQWVHIHSVTMSSELQLMERPDIAKNPATIRSLEAALARANKSLDEMGYLDFYSCFAIPVFNVTDHFGIDVNDPRGLTLTGGLPFFGGAGNNYSAHAICEAVERCRKDRGAFALVGANGGWMSKYSTGIYSTEPADWSANDRYEKLAKAKDGLIRAVDPSGQVTIETYTINHAKTGSDAVFIGRNVAGERVCGNADMSDDATRELFEGGEPFGAVLVVERSENGRNIGRLS